MDLPSVLSPVSPGGREVLHLFGIILMIAGFIVAVVAGITTVNILRFRARPGDRPPRQDPGDIRLEIVWTVVPFLILTTLFVLTVGFMHAVQPPATGRTADITVIAHQWWWEGHYADSAVVVANEFHIPAGRNILLRFHSDDVVHDWWVPQLGRKVDIFPNHMTYVWNRADAPGTYLGTCDEFCGPEHAWMRIRVVAQTDSQYAAWIDGQHMAPSPPTAKPAQKGMALFLTHPCANCHAIQGLTSGTIGPDLSHVGSRETIGAGILENNMGNLTHWIYDAQAVKPGCNMPRIGLTLGEAGQVAMYLEGLK